MADARAPRPRPPAPSSSGAPDDPLTELNDHLGRFLRHADELLDEWARFGADVRTRLDGELGRFDDALTGAADGAARKAAAVLGKQLEGDVVARVDRAIGDRVAALRVEIERLGRAAGAGQPSALPDAARWTWIGVAAANALLVVILVVLARGGGRGAPAAVAPDPAIAAACAALVEGGAPTAAAIVIRAGAAACGPLADQAAAVLTPAPVSVDAGVPDAGGPDAAPPDAAPPAPPKPSPHGKPMVRKPLRGHAPADE